MSWSKCWTKQKTEGEKDSPSIIPKDLSAPDVGAQSKQLLPVVSCTAETGAVEQAQHWTVVCLQAAWAICSSSAAMQWSGPRPALAPCSPQQEYTSSLGVGSLFSFPDFRWLNAQMCPSCGWWICITVGCWLCPPPFECWPSPSPPRDSGSPSGVVMCDPDSAELSESRGHNTFFVTHWLCWEPYVCRNASVGKSACDCGKSRNRQIYTAEGKMADFCQMGCGFLHGLGTCQWHKSEGFCVLFTEWLLFLHP